MHIVYNKAYELEEGAVTISINNKKVWSNTHGGITVANYFNQDVAAEASAIK